MRIHRQALMTAAAPWRSPRTADTEGWAATRLPRNGSRFRKVASWFSESSEYEFDVTAAGASGDLAYTVGYEHNRGKMDGEARTSTLRVTHIYRREGGQWRIVHRHGDVPPGEERAI